MNCRLPPLNSSINTRTRPGGRVRAGRGGVERVRRSTGSGESTVSFWGDALALAYVEMPRSDSLPCRRVTDREPGLCGLDGTGVYTCAGVSDPPDVAAPGRDRSSQRTKPTRIAVIAREIATSCQVLAWNARLTVESRTTIATAA